MNWDEHWVDLWVCGCMGGVEEQTDGCKGGWKNGWMDDGEVDGQRSGWGIDRWRIGMGWIVRQVSNRQIQEMGGQLSGLEGLGQKLCILAPKPRDLWVVFIIVVI